MLNVFINTRLLLSLGMPEHAFEKSKAIANVTKISVELVGITVIKLLDWAVKGVL